MFPQTQPGICHHPLLDEDSGTNSSENLLQTRKTLSVYPAYNKPSQPFILCPKLSPRHSLIPTNMTHICN
ncbi:hypothetical protein ILYODFUR_038500 [Ilyodon furcidens]|uniref:Uncharacterized protein n=1 Tax=Ilyodon furcidens TaxID=33524 RepID=A0ABV0UEX1_9TELE